MTPKTRTKRHHMVWVIVGDYVVRACTHCDYVKRSHLAQPGDAERADYTQRAHIQHCNRPWEALTIPYEYAEAG